MQWPASFPCSLVKSTLVSALLVASSPVQARLGESPVDCNLRYGGHERDAATLAMIERYPLLAGAQERRYNYKGWKIQAAFVDDAAVRVRYVKGPEAAKKSESNEISEGELITILKANLSPELTWKQVIMPPALRDAAEGALEPATYKSKWVRTDGRVAFVESGGKAILIQNTEVILNWQAAQERAKEYRQDIAPVPAF